MRRRTLYQSVPVMALLTVASGAGLRAVVHAPQSAAATARPPAPDPVGPALATESELRDLVERFSVDRFTLSRRYPMQQSPERVTRLKKFYGD